MTTERIPRRLRKLKPPKGTVHQCDACGTWLVDPAKEGPYLCSKACRSFWGYFSAP